MPKVFLTEQQRLESRNKKVRDTIADGLIMVKGRNRMSMDEMARKTGIGRNAISKLLVGEDVVIKLSNLIMVFDMAGLEIRPRTEAKQ